MEKLKNKLVEYFVTNKIIDEERKDILSYGMEIVISSVITIGLCILISVVIRQLALCLIFLLIYCPIRLFAGGYHAKTRVRCSFLFVVICLCNIFVSDFMTKQNSIVNGVKWIAVLIILLFSPIGCIENPIAFEYRKKMKIKTMICLVLDLIVIEVLENYSCEMANCASCTIITIALILIAGILSIKMQEKNWQEYINSKCFWLKHSK